MCHYNEVVGFSHFAPYPWNNYNMLPPTHVDATINSFGLFGKHLFLKQTFIITVISYISDVTLQKEKNYDQQKVIFFLSLFNTTQFQGLIKEINLVKISPLSKNNQLIIYHVL